MTKTYDIDHELVDILIECQDYISLMLNQSGEDCGEGKLIKRINKKIHQYSK